VCLLAGASRMRPVTFAALNVGGTVTRLLAIRALAASLPGPLEAALGFVRRFSLPLALVAASVAGLSCIGLLRQDGSCQPQVDQVPPGDEGTLGEDKGSGDETATTATTTPTTTMTPTTTPSTTTTPTITAAAEDDTGDGDESLRRR
ncbi:unnamed protein product, partial [Polarella glacialis]